MARIIQNDKEFKVIALSHEEGEALGWGIWHRNDEDTDDLCDFLCMHCNKPIEGELYYVAVLNDLMDEECYNKWYNNAKHYSDDRFIENHNFERVKGAIEMEYLIRCTNVGLR